jgi:hypothetical protein
MACSAQKQIHCSTARTARVTRFNSTQTKPAGPSMDHSKRTNMERCLANGCCRRQWKSPLATRAPSTSRDGRFGLFGGGQNLESCQGIASMLNYSILIAESLSQNDAQLERLIRPDD